MSRLDLDALRHQLAFALQKALTTGNWCEILEDSPYVQAVIDEWMNDKNLDDSEIIECIIDEEKLKLLDDSNNKHQF